MKVLSTIGEARAENIDGCSLIPTMGALHSGHISLVKAAAKLGKPIAVSIFVNPTQFGQGEDFEKYPRTLERDLAALENENVAWVFTPSVGEIYPHRSTSIHVPEVTEEFEGAIRPGHFDGVATIVCKLFQICKPANAFFGLKDLQQCAVINRMVYDLNLNVSLHFEETLREEDGLAKSSRNVYLDPLQRQTAPVIYQQILSVKSKLASGAEVSCTLNEAHNVLTSAGFQVDYFDLVNLDCFQSSGVVSERTAIVVAARLGSTRLIDNTLMFSSETLISGKL